MMNSENWDDLRLFLAVARHRGLSPAARETGNSPATLGRRMMALEQRLARDLFHRHDRGYTLTAQGQTLLSDLTDLEPRLARILAPAKQDALPLVKVSAGSWTSLALLNNINNILGSPPDIRLRFFASEEKLSLTRREIVIGFRNERPTGGNLASRRLSKISFAPYGTENASPLWINVLAETPSARWLARHGADRFGCEVNTPRNSLDLAIQGHGIALLPTFIGDAFPVLERKDNIIEELSHDQWLVTHNDDRHLPGVRAAIERMCQALKTSRMD
ncbi:LysR family transcriptional regulator [Shimia abyssi]|uniref:LysR family transcriptional regulator n=2 Tax=Shimia abyssi TaxID=1662395 RepID=A0A2P8FG69_9RHOB|nr:LysR family transcriptional regulator [Shimia abyssi]